MYTINYPDHITFGCLFAYIHLCSQAQQIILTENFPHLNKLHSINVCVCMCVKNDIYIINCINTVNIKLQNLLCHQSVKRAYINCSSSTISYKRLKQRTSYIFLKRNRKHI